MAVSGVMAFFARMISLMTCDGLPSRAASSFWVMPRASISSCKTSPGEIAISDATWEISVVIMIAHFLDDYAVLAFPFRHNKAPPARQGYG